MKKRSFRNKRFPVVTGDFKRSSHTGRNLLDKWRCVEVAIKPQGVAVRDSKNKTKGTLFFNHDEWKAFIAGVKDSEFDT